MNSNWIAGPGQFIVLGISWGTVTLFYLTLSWKLGKAIGSESDGCLLMFCNLLFVVIGAMIGLLLLHFPFNLISSMVLALILPSTVTGAWYRRNKLQKRP